MTTRSDLLIIFDMDGTVVDSMKPLTALAIEVLTFAFPGIRNPKEAYQSTVGAPFAEQVEKITAKMNVTADLRHRAAAHYSALHALLAPSFELTELGRSLASFRHDVDEDVHFALVSSTSTKIISRMDQLLPVGFDFMQGYRGPGWEKPEQIKDVLAEAQQSGYAVRACYVGDSPSDRQVAIDVGLPFFAETIELSTIIKKMRKAA